MFIHLSSVRVTEEKPLIVPLIFKLNIQKFVSDKKKYLKFFN